MMPTRVSPALIVFFGATCVATAGAFAQSGGAYTITKSTIDSGGGTSTGGSYSVSGTIGQPDAGVLSGGTYTLEGGFWNSEPAPAGVPCADNGDCVLADDAPNAVCTFDRCVANFCTQEPIEYGDVNGAGPNTPNLDDILCVLAGFSNYNDCPNADIHDAGAPTLCQSNGILNLDDILRVLATFAGQPPCAQVVCNEPCPQGACCSGLACDLESPGNCFARGDVFKGIGTACPPLLPNPCP